MKKLTILLLTIILVSTAVADLPSPVGWWEFEGNFNDSSGNGNNGTPFGQPIIADDPERGQVLSLNGQSDSVLIYPQYNLSVGTSDFTICAWIKAPQAQSDRDIFFNGNYSAQWYNLELDSTGKVRGALCDGTAIAYAQSDTIVDDNTWHHIAVVFDRDSGAQVYIDGMPDGPASDITSVAGDISSELSFIGVNCDLGQSFAGLIDDLRVYDLALSLEQIGEVSGIDLTIASDPSPSDDANNIPFSTSLSWSPGWFGDLHDIYFGKNYDDVNSASISFDPNNVYEYRIDVNSFDVSSLEPGTIYYWRIDEVNGPNVWKGDIWSFETVPQPAIINVPADHLTIQAAINVAHKYDTIIVAPGTYEENINFLGKKITVRSSDPNDWDTVKATIIDGQQLRSTVLFSNNETSQSVLDGFTIINGTYESYYYSGETISGSVGGGLCCLNSSPTIRRCYIANNYWNNYGAIGGGISCLNSSATIQNCYITNNGYYNGHISALYGGGIALLGNCSANITNCIITNNTARYAGSAIIVDSTTPDQATSTIRNCTILNNTLSYFASWGFQVDCWDTQTTISNTIICNPANERNGDLLIKEPSQVTYSCIQRTKLYNNSYEYHHSYYDEPLYDLTTTGGNIDDSPRFVQPFDNLGDSQPADYRLSPDSPCINAGDPAFVANGQFDIDGQPRIMDGRVEMGAYEARPLIVVNAPTAGDVWAAGSIHKIKWFNNSDYNVDILFSRSAGSEWEIIASNIPGSGPFTWNVFDIVDSSQCIISVVPHINDANVVFENSGLFTIHPQNSDIPTVHQWPSLGGNFSRSGLAQNNGPEIGCLKWQFTTDGPVYSGVSIAADGAVHIACEDGKLYTLTADGNSLWDYDVNSPLLTCPSIGPDGSVYVGAKDNKLYAIDKNGNLRWTFNTDAAIYSSPAVADDGTIYAGSQDGSLYAIAPDGGELWTFETDCPGPLDGSIFASPAIGPDGTIYIGGLYDPNLYALDPNGDVKWNCDFALYGKGKIFASPVVSADGETIYQVLLHDPNLYAVDANTGDVNWVCNMADGDPNWFGQVYYQDHDYDRNWPRYTLGTPGTLGLSEPVLGPDGTIYVSLDDKYLRAIDPNGMIKWAKMVGQVGGFTMAVANNGLIYAACDDAYLYVIDPDGNKIAQFKSRDLDRIYYENGELVSPVIAADNTLIISDAKNTVWAISADNCPNSPQLLHRPQDINADGIVSFPDLALMAKEWLDYTAGFDPPFVYEKGFYSLGEYGRFVIPPYEKLYPDADIDGDLNVDHNDLAILADNWLSED